MCGTVLILCHQFYLSLFLFFYPQNAEMSKHWQDGRQLREGARMNHRYQTLKLLSLYTQENVDGTVITDGSRSIAFQTDLTMKDLSDMEANDNSLKAELTIIQEENYLQRSQLEKNNNLLNFYIGFNCFTIFMPVVSL